MPRGKVLPPLTVENVKQSSNSGYFFDDVVVDRDNFCLRKLDQERTLTPRAFDVLVYLIEHRGRVVEKQELFEQIWKESFVTDYALARAIKEIRQALGDDAGAPRYIETVHKRGYRFIAELKADNGKSAEEVKAEMPGAAVAESAPPAREAEQTLVQTSISRIKKHRSGLLLLTFIVLTITGGAIYYFNRPPMLTSKDTVLLTDFDNKTGDAIFDGTLKQGLATQLQQGYGLDVFPDVRVRQALAQMERPTDARLTAEVAREMCERQHLKAFIAGSIAQLGSRYVLTLEALRGGSGEALARAQTEAESKEQVLQALSRATTQLCAQLGPGLRAIQLPARPLRQSTTADLRALKAYSECTDLASRGRFVEALPFAKHAAELDPQLSGVYNLLGVISLVAGQPEAAAEYQRKAFQLTEERAARQPDQVSEVSKIASLAWYHRLSTGNLAKAQEYGLLYRQLAPRSAPAYHDLGSAYSFSGQFEQAIPLMQEAIRLDPNFAAPYRGLGEALTRLNRFAEAKEALTRALQLQLEFTEYHTQLYQLAFIAGDNSGMQQQLAWARGKPDEYVAFDWQTGAAAFAGQWRRAQELSRQATNLAALGDNRELAARYATEQALRAAAFGDCQSSRASVAQGLAFGRGRIPLTRAALTLALCGATKQAQTLAEELTKRFPEDTASQAIWLPALRAALALQRGGSSNSAAQAIEQLQATTRYEAAAEFWPQYLRGQAYLQLKQGAEAAAEFQQILAHRGYGPLSTLYPLAHLGLARAAALTGDTAQRRQAYEDFFAVWKEADAELPILRAAKREARLAVSSPR
jgi:DNA-binding winged helix-turn-helix (wHTH) protein/Flp pilus assembly protein TadD